MNTNNPHPSPNNTNAHQSDVDTTRLPIEMKKVTASSAQDITQHFELQEESQSLLSAEQTPAEFFQILLDNGHYHDAITFLAHAIPAREAVWWACLCARYHLDNSDEQYQQALTAAETWVRKPTEENRRSAEKEAEAGNYDSPASWAAAAAFWSGGSIAPVDEPAMEPSAHLYAHAVAGAIVMSAGLGMPAEKDVKKRYQNYLKHGINVANGGNG